MGCDIHLYAEKRDFEGGDWYSIDTWEPDPYEDEPDRLHVLCPLYSGRNYDLFAILADVRNGRGFAGCDTGDGFVPIAEPRGVPADASPEYRAEVEQWGTDGHSHSHFTVAELMAYDWTQTTKQRGFVDAQTYHDWARWARGRGDGPQTCCGEVGGRGVLVLAEADMEAWVAEAVRRGDSRNDLKTAALMQDGKERYCRVEWGTAYYKAAGSFLSQTLPRLWRFVERERHDNVRIVFFFDN